MINLPILQSLDIEGYGLYPGDVTRDGLHIAFQPGLTLVLGANGLGKSTLVNIVYRMLTGPFDIPGLVGRTDLGDIKLKPTQLSPVQRSAFAQRVADNARNAKAKLVVSLDNKIVIIERRLSDLALTGLQTDQSLVGNLNEALFQSEITSRVGVWSFGEWILLLRHITFYFEDRKALVWDPSAQRAILRTLFLPANTAQQWYEDERSILELDSRMRNLNAVLTREERALSENEAKTQTGRDVREELKTLENLQQIDTDQRELQENDLFELDGKREQARLRFLRAELAQESLHRRVERARLIEIGTHFPSHSETAKYILAQLMTERQCLVCGNDVPLVAAEYAERIEHSKCIVCGSPLAEDEARTSANADELAVASAELQRFLDEVSEARQVLEDTERKHLIVLHDAAKLNGQINERTMRIDSLVRRLPPEEAEMHKQRSDLTSMRGRVAELKFELTSKRDAFGKFLETLSRDIVTSSEEIKSEFNRFAQGFLLEDCSLVWSPKRAKLGETGDMFYFPAFELDMTGTDFPSPVRRSGPDQVSESQREFIDLAFRMALMTVASSNRAGTLVMDAPESSLDAVFETRAANVLSRFAVSETENRLLITSNLVQGKLIPSLIDQSTIPGDRASRVLDLLSIAAPTAAVRELRSEYEQLWNELVWKSSDGHET